MWFPEPAWEWEKWIMDDRLRKRIQKRVRQLVAEEKSTFRGAHTLLDLENLTVTRSVASRLNALH